MAIIPEKVLKEQNATTLTEALRNVPVSDILPKVKTELMIRC